MSSLSKVCAECGLGLEPGLANCPHCGAQVGTLFSEAAPVPVNTRTQHRRPRPADSFTGDKIEKAKDRSNNALILALVSFFCPILGLAMGVSAIFLGASALSTFKQNNVEEGRGLAVAGIVIGGIGLIAQFSYILYFMSAGIPGIN
jgi:hypothetical protein